MTTSTGVGWGVGSKQTLQQKFASDLPRLFRAAPGKCVAAVATPGAVTRPRNLSVANRDRTRQTMLEWKWRQRPLP